jgi:hypothetical protein
MRYDLGVVFDSATAETTRKLLAWALNVGIMKKRGGALGA